MAKAHKINVSDKIQPQSELISEPAPERKTYVVTAEDGLFKSGKKYKKGDEIELDELTAKNFKELGEVKSK